MRCKLFCWCLCLRAEIVVCVDLLAAGWLFCLLLFGRRVWFAVFDVWCLLLSFACEVFALLCVLSLLFVVADCCIVVYLLLVILVDLNNLLRVGCVMVGCSV